jgi:hypothetical protein
VRGERYYQLHGVFFLRDVFLFGLNKLTERCNCIIGEYGIAKPWYFPFQKSYWFPDDLKATQHSGGSATDSNRLQSRNITSDRNVRHFYT